MEPEGSVLSLVSPKMLRFRLAALAAVSSLKKKDPAKEAVPAGPTAASTAFARHGSFATTTVPVMSEEAERRAGGCCFISRLVTVSAECSLAVPDRTGSTADWGVLCCVSVPACAHDALNRGGI